MEGDKEERDDDYTRHRRISISSWRQGFIAESDARGRIEKRSRSDRKLIAPSRLLKESDSTCASGRSTASRARRRAVQGDYARCVEAGSSYTGSCLA